MDERSARMQVTNNLLRIQNVSLLHLKSKNLLTQFRPKGRRIFFCLCGHRTAWEHWHPQGVRMWRAFSDSQLLWTQKSIKGFKAFEGFKLSQCGSWVWVSFTSNLSCELMQAMALWLSYVKDIQWFSIALHLEIYVRVQGVWVVQAVSIHELEFKCPLHYNSRGEQSKSLLILSINFVKPVIYFFFDLMVK